MRFNTEIQKRLRKMCPKTKTLATWVAFLELVFAFESRTSKGIEVFIASPNCAYGARTAGEPAAGIMWTELCIPGMSRSQLSSIVASALCTFRLAKSP